jgi:hypothetical protein
MEGGRAGRRGALPDRCPYHRPFSPDFDSCPAFQLTPFAPLDTRRQPLRPSWTCFNLTVRRHPASGYYACCRVGDQAARERWAEGEQAELMAALRRLRSGFNEATAPHFRRFWEVKARQVQIGARQPERRAAEAELATVTREFEAAFRRFFESHEEELARFDMTAELAMEIVRTSLSQLAERKSVEADWSLSDDLRRRLPPRARAFFAPPPK